MKQARWAALAALLLPLAAYAHHSFGWFDMSRTVTVSGTVKKFEWTNPHAWLWVTVTDAAGASQDWGAEFAALSMLRRQGYDKDTFKPGDKVTLQIHPLKDGQQGGSFVSGTFADGRTIGRTAAAGGPPSVDPAR